jgi:hypothetical protein
VNFSISNSITITSFPISRVNMLKINMLTSTKNINNIYTGKASFYNSRTWNGKWEKKKIRILGSKVIHQLLLTYQLIFILITRFGFTTQQITQ